MTVKWATARDVSATLKAVTSTGICTALQIQILLLNLAPFLIYVAPVSCISLQKLTPYFEKLVPTESNLELFIMIHLMISLQHIFDYTFPLHFSLVCALKTLLQVDSSFPLDFNKDQNAMFFPQFTISLLYVHSWSWSDCSCFSLPVTLELRIEKSGLNICNVSLPLLVQLSPEKLKLINDRSKELLSSRW